VRALRHARAIGLVALTRNIRDLDSNYQAIADNQVLFDGTAV